MKSASKILSNLLTGLVFYSSMTNAANFSGQLDAAGINWHSGINIEGGVASAFWDLPINLPTGESIIPGGHTLSSPNVGMTLQNVSGDSIDVPLTITGIQYRLANSTSVLDVPTGTNASVTGDIVTVLGSGIGDKRINFDTTNSMVIAYRPLIDEVDAAAVLAELEGKPEGTYTGRVNIPFQYDYYRNGTRIRHILTLPMSVSITYSPAYIFDAEITSGHDGKLIPRYHGTPETLVSASGNYGVRISGDFASGLNARIDSTSPLYTLKSVSDESSEILYSVQCIAGCLSGEKVMIDKGISSLVPVQIDNSNSKEANIMLNVSFENKLYSELVPGMYDGHFRVIFEAEL